MTGMLFLVVIGGVFGWSHYSNVQEENPRLAKRDLDKSEAKAQKFRKEINHSLLPSVKIEAAITELLKDLEKLFTL